MKKALTIGVFLIVSVGLFSVELWNGIDFDTNKLELLNKFHDAKYAPDSNSEIIIPYISWKYNTYNAVCYFDGDNLTTIILYNIDNSISALKNQISILFDLFGKPFSNYELNGVKFVSWEDNYVKASLVVGNEYFHIGFSRRSTK